MMAAVLLGEGAGLAQAPRGLSFEAAVNRLDGASPGLQGRDHDVASARALADATKALNRPIISASASVIEYQKTLSIDLSGAKGDATRAANDVLADLPGQFPPGMQQIVGDVLGRVTAAVPGVISAIPDDLRLQSRETVLRPTVQSIMPLYTGGAIGAVQRGADAVAGVAEAMRDGNKDLSRVNLVRTYFGQLLAGALVRSTRETLDSLDRHLSDAVRLERGGLLAHARVLQVQVARDTAARAYVRAQNDEVTARDSLARLMDLPEGVAPTSDLFVASAPLPPVATFLGTVSESPRARGADAARAAARSGVSLARSRFLPQVFAYGEYNLDRDRALPTEPDWIVGVTARYTILSNVDRRRTLDAAKERDQAAASAAAQTRKDVAEEIVRSWNLVETARQSFLLLDSSIAAADENLRVQRASFLEGEVAADALIDAEASLANARTQRLSAAFEYDLGLMGLLAASHRVEEYAAFLSRADRRLEKTP